MADLIYPSFKEGLGKGHFDLAADILRCALLTSAYVPSAGHAALAAADPSWTEASVTARYALIYVAKTVAGRTNPLVCLLDFGADRGVTGGTFAVRFDASGVLALE